MAQAYHSRTGIAEAYRRRTGATKERIQAQHVIFRTDITVFGASHHTLIALSLRTSFVVSLLPYIFWKFIL